MKHFNYKKFLPVLAVILAISAVLAVPLAIHADFGDFAGDNDYGGGGNSGGGHSSSSDDDDSALIWIIFELFRVIYRLFGLPGVIIFALLLVVGYMLFKRKKNNNQPVIPGAQRTDRSNLAQMYSYRQVDPEFDEAAFREKLSNLYVQFQNAWTGKNMESLRPYLTDAMYAQFDRQLDAYRRNGQTNYVDRIAVLGVELAGWKQESGKDVVIAEIRTRIVDYVKNDTTGELVRGSMSQEKFMTYEWTLVRTTGTKTGQSTGLTGQTCPNCGAHIDINHTAVCEYCGSVLTIDTFDWVVSNIKGLSQQTK